METIKITARLSAVERETIIDYDNLEKKWIMSSYIPKHFNKAIKQGWTPVKQFVYADGYVCGMVLEAPAHAITIRSAEKKPRKVNQENDDDEDC